jgi:hypothetical protein
MGLQKNSLKFSRLKPESDKKLTVDIDSSNVPKMWLESGLRFILTNSVRYFE